MKASLNPTALFLVSFLALAVNIAVFVYHFAKVLKYKRDIAVGVHSHLSEYQALVTERSEQRPGLRLGDPALARGASSGSSGWRSTRRRVGVCNGPNRAKRHTCPSTAANPRSGRCCSRETDTSQVKRNGKLSFKANPERTTE